MSKKKAEKTEDKENATWKDKLTKKTKQFKKTRWFPLTVALLIIGLGIVFAFLLGFRITYAPALENSWNAISGVAAWVGVIVSILSAVASFMAVWYAIRVADKQNQITLFEKRYECFQFFEECFVLYRNLNSGASDELTNALCCHMLGVENLNEINKYNFQNQIKRFEYLIHQMEFLFSGIKEKDAKELFDSLSLYIKAIINEQNTEDCKQRYVKAMIEFGKYADEIWSTMELSI